MDKIAEYSDEITQLALVYGPKLIGALIVLIIGLWIIKRISKLINKTFEKRNIDPSLRPFLSGLISTLLKVFLIVTVLGMVGIAMTSFAAIIASVGLAVGLALSGTLQNFAGGVILLILKPFKVGDFIEAQSHGGTVNSIQIFNTVLKTPDNKTIILPNGKLSTESIVNYSTEPTRRVDTVYGIGYGDDIQKAREILLEIFKADERIFQDPEPFIKVTELGDSSVNLATRVWCLASDYWPIKMACMEKVYNQFNAHGINIPFPQMDIHLHKEEK